MVRSLAVLMVALAGVAGAQGTPTPYTPGSNSTNDNPPAENAAPSADEPTVRVTMNGSGVYDRGDRARVSVRVRDDGYVVALHETPDGRVLPLYPIDPTADGFVRGGSEFEIQSRGADASFVVDGRGGNGTVYVAYSKDPFNFTDFARGGHWDFDAFPDSGVAGHAEAVMTDLVQHMATQHFDYDLATYSVTRSFHRQAAQQQALAYDDQTGWDPYYTPVLVAYEPWYGPGWYGDYPYWYSPFFFGVGFGYGWGWGGFGGWGWGGYGCCWGGGGRWGNGRWGNGRWGGGWGGGFARPGYINRTGVTTVNGGFAGSHTNVFAAGHLGAGGFRSTTGQNGAFSNVSLRGSVAGASRAGSTVFSHSVSGSPAAMPNSGRVVTSGNAAQGSRVTANRVAQPSGGIAGGQRNFSSGGQFNGGSRVSASRVAPQERGPSAEERGGFEGGRANVGGGLRAGPVGGARGFSGGGRSFSGGLRGGSVSGGFHGGGGGGGHGGGGHR